MRRSCLLSALLSLGLAVSTARAVPPIWRSLPPSLPADSMVASLRGLEIRGPRALAASAAYGLGQLHHARGEYRLAAEAFGRAAARLSGQDRADARYRQGVAWLGAQEPGRARASFEEAASSSQALRAFAQLGLAQAYALAGEPAREKTVLDRLIAGPAGEAEPAALERYAVLSDRLHREGDAQSARERLRRRWPRSFEAARESQPDLGAKKP
jgi:tetratricopeptide (TPR) repeat protein